jgi:hypothetical protein
VRGFEQLEAVTLGFGESLLVAEYDVVGVFVEFAEGDEATPFFYDLGSGNFETLRVGIDAGVFFLGEYTLFAPGLEIAGGA